MKVESLGEEEEFNAENAESAENAEKRRRRKRPASEGGPYENKKRIGELGHLKVAATR